MPAGIFPATTADVNGLAHTDILALCDWYNDTFGILAADNIATRRAKLLNWINMPVSSMYMGFFNDVRGVASMTLYSSKKYWTGKHIVLIAWSVSTHRRSTLPRELYRWPSLFEKLLRAEFNLTVRRFDKPWILRCM